MTVLVDTSALYALLSETDRRHDQARAVWVRLEEQEERLLATNYVLIETIALVGRRLGIDAVRSFQGDLVPVLEVVWIDALVHHRAVGAALTAGVRDLSVVDCASFEIMRQMGIEQAFAFDAHFTQQGFVCLG